MESQLEQLPNQSDTSFEYILGMTIGVRSIGWAIFKNTSEDLYPSKQMIGLGTRVFEPGVEGDINKGQYESRSYERRSYRQKRRQNDRKASRNKRLLKYLQEYGLLPMGDISTSHKRHNYLIELDQRIRKSLFFEDPHSQQNWLYQLRKRCVVDEVDIHFIGRAIYHIAQKRGYRSNRQNQEISSDVDRSKVLSQIVALKNDIDNSQSKSLGAYLSAINPGEIQSRSRFTDRKTMQISEFDLIWELQSKYHAEMTNEAKKIIKHCLFFQRPLRGKRGLLGSCSLEPQRKRLPEAHPLAQKFRILRIVNSLKIISENHMVIDLTNEQRKALLLELDTCRELTWAKAKRVIELNTKKLCMSAGLGQKIQFNYEINVDVKTIPGNRTRVEMLDIFGSTWDQMSDTDQEQIVYDIIHYRKPEAFRKRASEAYGLKGSSLEKICSVVLDEGYCEFSKMALHKLIDDECHGMSIGFSFSSAKKHIYRDISSGFCKSENLESLNRIGIQIDDPIIRRALVELRKVVNSLISKYGKPVKIHYVLEDDLKYSKKQRNKRYTAELSYQRQFLGASNKLKGKGIEPTDDLVQKYLLSDECNWICPYTGKHFTVNDLVDNVDIAHIIPFYLTLNDSWDNLTICDAEFHRHYKFNRMPSDACKVAGTDFEELLDRVGEFDADRRMILAKRRKFILNHEDLHHPVKESTGYIEETISRYFSSLYGTPSQAEYKIKHCPMSFVIAFREYWNITNDDLLDYKNYDHRKHAIDALIVAMFTQARLSELIQAASSNTDVLKKFNRVGRLNSLSNEKFIVELTRLLQLTITSHAVSRKIAGPLHSETKYSPLRISYGSDGKKHHSFHIRKSIDTLTVKNIYNDIVDPKVSEAVRNAYEELQQIRPNKSIKDLFKNTESHPVLITKKGTEVPIHRVRIRVNVNAFSVGAGDRQRYVKSKKKSNHHLVVLSHYDLNGEEKKWSYDVTSRLEASRRLVKGESPIRYNWGNTCAFICSLSCNDCIEISASNSTPNIFRVISLSTKEVELQHVNDARGKNLLRTLGGRIRFSPQKMRESEMRKVSISPRGEIFENNE